MRSLNEARAVLLGRRPSAASAPRSRASASASEQIAQEASARARAAETARLAVVVQFGPCANAAVFYVPARAVGRGDAHMFEASWYSCHARVFHIVDAVDMGGGRRDRAGEPDFRASPALARADQDARRRQRDRTSGARTVRRSRRISERNRAMDDTMQNSGAVSPELDEMVGRLLDNMLGALAAGEDPGVAISSRMPARMHMKRSSATMAPSSVSRRRPRSSPSTRAASPTRTWRASSAMPLPMRDACSSMACTRTLSS